MTMSRSQLHTWVFSFPSEIHYVMSLALEKQWFPENMKLHRERTLPTPSHRSTSPADLVRRHSEAHSIRRPPPRPPSHRHPDMWRSKRSNPYISISFFLIASGLPKHRMSAFTPVGREKRGSLCANAHLNRWGYAVHDQCQRLLFLG